MLITVLLLVLAFPALVQAQSAEPAKQYVSPEGASNLFLWTIIMGTACLTIAAVGGAWSQSRALRAAVENIARNPAAADSIRGVLIIGLALIESLVIYVLLVDLILYFVRWGSYFMT